MSLLKPFEEHEEEDFDCSYADEEELSGSYDTGTSGSDRAGSDSDDGDVTKNETKWVNGSKLLVYVALTLAAAAVASTAYIILRNEEEKTMQGDVSAVRLSSRDLVIRSDSSLVT